MHPVYRGIPRQTGHGLGSLFRSALSTVTPFLKPVVNSSVNLLKQQGLKQGIAAAHDILVGHRKPKEVLVTRGKQVLKRLGKQVLDSLGSSINSKRRKTSRQMRVRRPRVNIVQRHRKKSPRSLDIFD